jgi:hypothetical protein
VSRITLLDGAFYDRTFFICKVNFFPPNFFLMLEKRNLSEQKILAGKKICFAKKFFSLAKKVIRL